jgi:hypothetical protein
VSGDDAVLVVSDGDFEDGLCQVDGDDIRLHAWTPSVQVHSVIHTRMLAHRDAEKEREESISSLQPTPESAAAPTAASFWGGATELSR